MEENGQKQPKTKKYHHKQCIFDPKMANTAKSRIFPDTTLPFDDSKQLMCGFEENVRKPDFLAKNGQKW